MSDYEVGYGKPPKYSRFRKGICANPRGRGKRRRFEAEEILKAVLFAEMDYKEGGKARRASRLEIAVRTLAAKAVKGDIASAMLLLTMRIHAEKHGDGGPLVIRIINALPDSKFLLDKPVLPRVTPYKADCVES
jgi:Family of unknown function (DUF5681)